MAEIMKLNYYPSESLDLREDVPCVKAARAVDAWSPVMPQYRR